MEAGLSRFGWPPRGGASCARPLMDTSCRQGRRCAYSWRRAPTLAGSTINAPCILAAAGRAGERILPGRVPPFGRGPCCLEYVTCLNDSGRLSRCTMRARRAELRLPRPVRLVAQDSALSRRRQGFDSPTGYFRRGILARGGCAHEDASAWRARRRNRALAPRG
jgi:hypothetical protein